MAIIRIPPQHWEEVWDYLVGTGPISRVSEDTVYYVSDRQVRLLRKKKLPFQLIQAANGSARKRKHA